MNPTPDVRYTESGPAQDLGPTVTPLYETMPTSPTSTTHGSTDYPNTAPDSTEIVPGTRAVLNSADDYVPDPDSEAPALPPPFKDDSAFQPSENDMPPPQVMKNSIIVVLSISFLVL